MLPHELLVWEIGYQRIRYQSMGVPRGTDVSSGGSIQRCDPRLWRSPIHLEPEYSELFGILTRLTWEGDGGFLRFPFKPEAIFLDSLGMKATQGLRSG